MLFKFFEKADGKPYFRQIYDVLLRDKSSEPILSQRREERRNALNAQNADWSRRRSKTMLCALTAVSKAQSWVTCMKAPGMVFDIKGKP